MIKKTGIYIVALTLLGSFATVQAKIITVGPDDGERIVSSWDPDLNYVADGYSYISIDSIIADELENGDTIILNSDEYYHMSETVSKSVTIKAGENYSPGLGFYDYGVSSNAVNRSSHNQLRFYLGSADLPLLNDVYAITLEGLTTTIVEFVGGTESSADVSNYSLTITNTTADQIRFFTYNKELTELNIDNSTLDFAAISIYQGNGGENQAKVTLNNSSFNVGVVLPVLTDPTKPIDLEITGSTVERIQSYSRTDTIIENSAFGELTNFVNGASLSMNRSIVNGTLLLYSGAFAMTSDANAEVTNTKFIGKDVLGLPCYLASETNSRLSNVTMTNCEQAIKIESPRNSDRTYNNSFENMLFVDNLSVYNSELASPSFADNFSYSLFDELPDDLRSLLEGINGNVVGAVDVDEDFNLLEGSLGVDIGNNDAAGIGSIDFNGNPRIQDATGDGFANVDMGATEVAAVEVIATEGLALLADVQNAISDFADTAENLTALNSLYIGVAESYLTYAQNNLYWNDDNTLDNTYGGYAMLYTSTAVANLNLTANLPGTDPAVKAFLIEQSNRLVESMRLHATKKIEEAVAENGRQVYIDIANRYLDRGDTSRSKPAYPNQSLAVTYYRYAWTYANIAM